MVTFKSEISEYGEPCSCCGKTCKKLYATGPGMVGSECANTIAIMTQRNLRTADDARLQFWSIRPKHAAKIRNYMGW
jgi:hypothetical protein